MHCFVCGDADAEYGLNDLDCAEFLAEKISAANPNDQPPPATAAPIHKIRLCHFCRESLEDHDEPETIIAGLLLAAAILLPPSG